MLPGLQPFDFQLRTRFLFGCGSLARVGEVARELHFQRTLLVADPGLVAAGHAQTAAGLLAQSGVETILFSTFDVNPDSDMIERGRVFAAGQQIDSLVALGGGSSMDCAKAINLVLTNGGNIEDYWGYGKATQPLLPMIGIPTTTGTGSEAQSYALISHARTHAKMACGDPKIAFRAAILDPNLVRSQPAGVRATAGYDAISHAVESWVTKRRNAVSASCAREAWRLLTASYERMLVHPDDIEALGAMQIGACWAGLAIENSMLGATHACANPLTARYGTAHGVAIAILLPHVVRWNESAAGMLYRELFGAGLAERLRELADAGGLPSNLRAAGVSEADLPQLAEEAATQWTGRFNPRPFDAAGAREIYQCAF